MLFRSTAIAALIELNNELVALPELPREIAEPLVLLVSPLAPHLAEELWSRLGNSESVTYVPWPHFDPNQLVEDTVEYPIQVNGKLRGRITVAANADDATIQAAALAEEKTVAAMAGKAVKKIIVVKGKLVNIVVA